MAHNILGTSENVKSFNSGNFKEFVRENIDTERIVVSFVGNVPLKRIERLVKKHLAHIPRMQSEKKRSPFTTYEKQDRQEIKDILQAHYAMGRPAFSVSHEKRLPFAMLVNLLGGPGMNTRLNLALRERLGYVYGVEASYLSYTNTGLFAIFFATEKKNLKRSINAVHREISRLKEKKLGTVQLHSLKEQMMGHLAIAAENNTGMMLSQAKSLLDLGKINSIDNIFDKIRKVSAEDLQELAISELKIDEMSTMSYIPKKNGVY
jgi:predicted Zn-dependent peptidase